MEHVISLKENLLILMRGVPGSGKTTWLKSHGVEDYAISPDAIRLMLSNPVPDKDGVLGINQAVSGKAWEMAYEMLESRMEHGGATFFDATFMQQKGFNAIKAVADRHNFRIVVIDFTYIGLTEAYRRNSLRKGTIRYVPPFVLERMWKTGKEMDMGDVEIIMADSPVKIIPF